MNYFRGLGVVVIALGSVAALAADGNPKEATGFFGSATGTVKSAKPDGTGLVLTVASAEPDAKQSAVKAGEALVGKDLVLGVRMPRDTDGKPHPHEDDVAFVKSLKAGETIKVTIFAVRSDPSVLRITRPGTVVEATKSPAK